MKKIDSNIGEGIKKILYDPLFEKTSKHTTMVLRGDIYHESSSDITYNAISRSLYWSLSSRYGGTIVY